MSPFAKTVCFQALSKKKQLTKKCVYITVHRQKLQSLYFVFLSPFSSSGSCTQRQYRLSYEIRDFVQLYSCTAVCTARIPVELKIDFSTRGAVHYVRPCSNSPPAVVASSTSSNKSSGGHRHKRSSATPTKDTHQHQHTTNNSNTNSTQQNKVKASTAPHTRISNRTNMATMDAPACHSARRKRSSLERTSWFINGPNNSYEFTVKKI